MGRGVVGRGAPDGSDGVASERWLERLGGAAQDAPDLPAFRRALLGELVTVIGADTATALPCPVRLGGNDSLHGIACFGVDPRLFHHYIDNHARYVPSLRRLEHALARDHAPVADHAVYSAQERQRLDVYIEAVIPAGIHALMCARVSSRGKASTVICLNRHGAGAVFHDEDVARLRALLPAIGMIDAAVAARSRPSAPAGALPALTPRELEVATLICTGLQNKEIAAALGTATDTVRKQTIRLYEKCGVSGRVELIMRFGDALAPAGGQPVTGS